MSTAQVCHSDGSTKEVSLSVVQCEASARGSGDRGGDDLLAGGMEALRAGRQRSHSHVSL